MIWRKKVFFNLGFILKIVAILTLGHAYFALATFEIERCNFPSNIYRFVQLVLNFSYFWSALSCTAFVEIGGATEVNIMRIIQLSITSTIHYLIKHVGVVC